MQQLSIPSNSWPQRHELLRKQRPLRNRCLPFGRTAACGASLVKPQARRGAARFLQAPPCPSASWHDPQGSGAYLQPFRPQVQPPLHGLQALAATAAAVPSHPSPIALGVLPAEEDGSDSSSSQGVWDGDVDRGGLQEPFAVDHACEMPSQAVFHQVLLPPRDRGQQLHPAPQPYPARTEQHNLRGSTHSTHSSTSVASICSTDGSVSNNAPTAAHLLEPALLPALEEHIQNEALLEQHQQLEQLQQKQQQHPLGSGTNEAAVQIPMPQCSDPNQQPIEALVTRFVGDRKRRRPSAAHAGGDTTAPASTGFTQRSHPSESASQAALAAAPPSRKAANKVANKSRQASQARGASTKPAVAASTLQQSPMKAKATAKPSASSEEESHSRPQSQRSSKLTKQPRSKATLSPSNQAKADQHTGPGPIGESKEEVKDHAGTEAVSLEAVLERHALPPDVSQGLQAAVEGSLVSKYITPRQLDKLLLRVLDAGEDLGVSVDTLHTVLRRHPNVLLKQPLTVLRAKAAALKELLGCTDEAFEPVKVTEASSATASNNNSRSGGGGSKHRVGRDTEAGSIPVSNSSCSSSGDCRSVEGRGDTEAGSIPASGSSNGFSGEAVKNAYPPITLSRVLSVVPCLWGYKVDTTRHKLDSLASMLDLPQEETTALARRCPTLLTCAPDSMAAKTTLLQELTGLPRKQIAAMVIEVPQMLFLSRSAMAAKFHDLVKLLGVKEQEVAQMVSSRPMLLTSATDTLRANWEELSGVASRSVRWRHELHNHLAPSTRAYLLMASKVKTRRLHYLLATGAHARTTLNSVLLATHEQFCLRFPAYKRWSPTQGGVSAASMRIAALKQRMASSSKATSSGGSSSSSSSSKATSSGSSSSSSSSTGSGNGRARAS